jgi:ribonuclease HII
MLRTSYSDKYASQVGCDEVGRGCLAGPVVAAAVLLPSSYQNIDINDSKSMSHAKREVLKIDIKKHAIAYGIGICSPEEIDEINILQASIRAMHRAIDQIKFQMDLLLIDGNKFNPYPSVPHQCIIRGDSIYQSIAAASILAKTYRDDLMCQLAEEYPEYMLHKNKGYASPEHIAAIERVGYSPIHRKTFKLKKLSAPPILLGD